MEKWTNRTPFKIGQIMTHKKVTKVTALKKDAINNLLRVMLINTYKTDTYYYIKQ